MDLFFLSFQGINTLDGTPRRNISQTQQKSGFSSSAANNKGVGNLTFHT